MFESLTVCFEAAVRRRVWFESARAKDPEFVLLGIRNRCGPKPDLVSACKLFCQGPDLVSAEYIEGLTSVTTLDK